MTTRSTTSPPLIHATHSSQPPSHCLPESLQDTLGLEGSTKFKLNKLDSLDSGVGRDHKNKLQDNDSGNVTDYLAPMTPGVTPADCQQIIASLMDFKVSREGEVGGRG